MSAEVVSANGAASFHVVGIGASAGGLDALERFFDNVPPDTGMAFIVVQHLSPDFKSLMAELLARHTKLPIQLVEDGMRIEPDHVYLIPPKKEMIIAEGRLLLSERDHHQQELSLPIDVFFRSLAQDCGSRAVAIVLSGGGSDGSRGVRDVHDAGGLVLVQDTESAQFDGMPKTARDAGVAHGVLAPQDMPEMLLQHAAKSLLPLESTVAPAPSSPRTKALDGVYRTLETEFGIDFNHYKPSTVTRRIERRVQLALAGDIGEYAERVQRERGELDRLYRDLLIGVTRFFRNEDAFRIIEQRVLPELFARSTPDVPIRVWVAGCATGEEAYSLAILLHEAAARQPGRTVKIFASDVHRGSLEIAGRAVYEADAVGNVTPERLQRYFVRRGESYQVVPEIRQLIVFAPHNVIRDAPFTHMDLISCRNLLIYLQPQAQQKALSLFHFGLNRGGIVFLGPSESLGILAHDFETVDKHWRIYRKHTDARTPVDVRLQVPKLERQLNPAQASPPRQSIAHMLGIYDTLLEEFMPPGFLVSDRCELSHVFGGASKFLRFRDGRPASGVLDAVESELKLVLVGGLKRVFSENTKVVFTNVRLCVGQESKPYRVTVRPVAPKNRAAPSALVLFEEMQPPARGAAEHPTEIDAADVPHAEIAGLQGELDSVRENLQAAIEELETSNEEMQTTNEELHASNEELQSTNEELQSVNEELYSVNAEYQRKIAELTELTNDMDNLLSSTDIGTIFLNRELTLRKFTPQIAQTFKLLPQDVGRSIETFTHNIHHPELIEDLKRVLASGERIERELQDREDRCFFLRILPYRAKGEIDGVVLTLIDVSGLKSAEDALFHERYLFNSLLSTVPDAIYFKDARGRFIRANKAVAAQFGLTDPRALVGKTPFELTDTARASALQAEDAKVLESGEPQHYRLERTVQTVGPAGQPAREQWVVATRHPLVDRTQHPVGVITMLRDVTPEKQAEEKIQEAIRRRDQFLAMLSHELRNPLGAVVTATKLAKDSASLDEGLVKWIHIIDRQAQQMSRLLDDLLEASRVTQDKIELRKKVLDLRPIVREAADAVSAAMTARNLTLTLDIDDGQLCVNGDPARLQQLQMNLLSNAAKYTPPGGHVTLSAKREAETAVIRVSDDGVGIPPDMLDSVFDLFVQSQRTLDRSDGGLGVGLTLVRALVTMHGGSVTAESEGAGKGSQFIVRLPLVSELPEAASSSRGRPKVQPGARVVIVEDNVDSREILCEFLEHAGCECHTAGTGPDGLELVARVHPLVALIDLGLPGMDGLELARHLRADPRNADVFLVALTGYGQVSDRVRALEAGFNEHVVKPIGPESLFRLLARGAERHQASAQ